jgi:hypothetical protein
VVQSATAPADRLLVAPAVPARASEIGADLLKLFGSVSDGRSGRGRDHPVAAVLALAAAAVVAGMKGYTAIAGALPDASTQFRASSRRIGPGHHLPRVLILQPCR